jgi:hypothetical protein
MRTTLDGQSLFDESQLEIELDSPGRDFVSRAVPGLDGILSIDLGKRSRKIRQKGVLRAKSRSQMDDRLTAISQHMDGDIHTLATSTGRQFENLRMDTFKVVGERTNAGSIAVDYEITYTQLQVQ